MKRLLIAFLFFAFSVSYAQEDAWVYFTDKPNAQFYLDNPLEMLSQRALDRRAAQGIITDESDVPVDQPYVDEVDDVTEVIVMAKSKWLNAVHVRGTASAINSLEDLEFVQSIDFANNTLNTGGRPVGKGMAGKGTQSYCGPVAEFNYGTSSSQTLMLNGQVLHEQDFTGTGMLIAVMDNGFPGVNTSQPFQRANTNGLILGGYNFVEGNDAIYTGGDHGTKVLSTLCGYVEGSLIGTAPDASYLLFVTEDATEENPVEESYWVEAAEMADSLGVDVINTSLGYFIYDNPAYNYDNEELDGETAFISRGVNMAFSKGMICVVSAGNTGNSSQPRILVPADAPGALTIGAVNFEEIKAGFSSIGPTADERIKPDVMAQGVAAAHTGTDGVVTFGNGTSFSSPITAGLVACLWQGLPDKTNSEIIDLIKGSADRFNNPDNEYGYGIPDFAWALNELSVNQPVKQEFIVYPNPVKHYLNITLPEYISKGVFTVYNVLGQIVQQVTLAQNSVIALDELATGIYNYKITDGSHVQYGKLIKE